MSGVLKAGDPAAQAAVRGLDAVQAELFRPHPADGEPVGTALLQPQDPIAFPDPAFFEAAKRDEELDRQCMELEATVAALRHRLGETDGTIRAREEAAYAKGKADGVQLSSADEEKRTALLAATLDKLQQTHATRLAELELLALQIARAALGRIVGDEQLRPDLVTATVQNYLARVRREPVTGIRLSPQDFGQDAPSAALAGRFPDLPVEYDDRLDTGGCAVDMRLGQIDLGIPGQWQRLSEYFDLLAQGEQAG